jgi:hypothetical protein
MDFTGGRIEEKGQRLEEEMYGDEGSAAVPSSGEYFINPDTFYTLFCVFGRRMSY